MKWEIHKNSARIPSSETRVRHGVIPVSYTILMKGKKILLLRRSRMGHEEAGYSLIAGHVESGESFMQCAIRESKKKVGISLVPDNIFAVHTMHRNSGSYKNNNERVDMFFVATQWTGKITNREPQKCAELLWRDVDQLPDNTIPYIAQAINKIVQEECYSEWGWN